MAILTRVDRISDICQPVNEIIRLDNTHYIDAGEYQDFGVT